MPKVTKKTPKQNDDSDNDIPELEDTGAAGGAQTESSDNSKVSETPNFAFMKVDELKDILKKYGAKVSGRKQDLVKRANEYFETIGHWEKSVQKNEEAKSRSDDFLQELTEKRRIFKKSDLTWSDIESFPSASIPDMEYETISSFLTNCYVTLDGESVPCGTDKPTVKGEHMYKSEKVQLCEFALVPDENLILFRANMSASMKTTEIR